MNIPRLLSKEFSFDLKILPELETLLEQLQPYLISRDNVGKAQNSKWHILNRDLKVLNSSTATCDNYKSSTM